MQAPMTAQQINKTVFQKGRGKISLAYACWKVLLELQHLTI